MKKLSFLISTVVLIIIGIAFAGGDIEKGKKLFSDPSLGTNGKSCESCHPKGRGINGQKSTFTIMGKKQKTLEEAINFCIEMALKGKPLPKDSEKMQNLATYLRTLDVGRKVRKRIEGC
jgi:cytochrome c